MHGRVESGALVTLTPIESHEDIRVDDVVLVRVQGRVYLHLVKARDGDRLQIGNNRGGINGWVRTSSVYGIATKIEN